MTNTLGKATLAVITAGAALALATSALASEEQKPDENLENLERITPTATTANVCATTTVTPAGWVDVQWWNSPSCGSSFAPNAKQIMQLTGLPVGTTVNACGSTFPPSGWSQTASYYSSQCRYSSVPSLDPNTWTLKRVY